MATRYGYDKAIGLTGPLSVDWKELTNSTVTYLNQIQEKKDTEKKEVAQEARDLALKFAKNPFDYTSSYNSFWGKGANQSIELYGKINKDYADGKITKTDRDIKVANAQGQVEQFVSASTIFADQEKERAKQSGPNGTYGAEDIFENGLLASALNYENIEPLFDPDSATFNALVTGEDGVKRIVSANQLYQTVQRPIIGKYDMNKNIKEQFETIGVKTIESADGSIIAGDFVTKQGEEADNALRNLAQSMISQPAQLRSMLSTYPISIEEEGKVNTYEFDRKLLPEEAYDIGGNIKQDVLKKLQDQNPTTFYRDTQGNYYESDRAKEIGEKYAMERLMLAAEYKEKEAKGEKDISMTDKIRNIALYGDKVPIEFIEETLTPEEFEEYKTFINKSGGRSAIGKVIDDLTFMISPEQISDADFQNKDSLEDYLKALETVGVKAEVAGSGAFGLLSKPFSITLTERGGDDGVTIELGDKNKRQVIEEIVRIIPTIRSLEDIALGMKITQAQIPSLNEWSRRPENSGKTPLDYIQEFNLQTVD